MAHVSLLRNYFEMYCRREHWAKSETKANCCSTRNVSNYQKCKPGPRSQIAWLHRPPLLDQLKMRGFNHEAGDELVLDIYPDWTTLGV